jgi:hypothetical protein
MLSVLERIPEEKLKNDKKRLESFLKNKTDDPLFSPVQGVCCSSNIKRRTKGED